ncbi:collagen alpha-1(I) chain-like [Molothrus ater]|uniref:collagen alpha-1(I) chain-like n=1 Tax=Molothrus ater TaxID=84834 RepID=UPI0023E7B1A3|nr:collagen alpha-1(I) chain-like [Molothrus ater]
MDARGMKRRMRRRMGMMALLALLALCAPPPSSAAPAPPPSRLCGPAAPPPPPTPPPPPPPDCEGAEGTPGTPPGTSGTPPGTPRATNCSRDAAVVAPGGDVELGGTRGPGSGPGDTVGHLSEAPGDATTAVAPVTATPGGDKALVGARGDVGVEGTEDPGVTGDPRDALGHLSEAPGDATTVVAPVTTSPGSDNVLAATSGDGNVAMEGTGDPGATSDPRDALGHLNEAPGDATTVVTFVTTSPGGDEVLVGTQSDVAMEGTGDPGVTAGPGDTLGHLNEAPGDATTMVAPVTATPGGDKVLVGTQSDVGVEGTAQPNVTGDPGDTLGHLNEAPADATTVVTFVTTSPGGDEVLAATSGDVAMEGTEETHVLCGPGDTLGRVPEAPGDATTVVAPVTVTPGGDKVLVGTQSDVAMEGTGDPGVTAGPGDTLGHLNEAPGDATTMVAPVTTSPGSDKVLVGTQGDVGVEGTEDPGVTGDPGDIVGHLNEVHGDATTTVTSVPVSPGGDKVLAATSGDVAMEGTAQPGVTGGPGDTLGHLNEAPGDATTVVAPVTATPGGDKVLVGTQSDIKVEGTAQPGVTGGPGDIVGHLNEAPRDATTVALPVTSSPGSDKMLLANGGDVAMEGTEETRVLCGPGDIGTGVTEAPGDATTMVAPGDVGVEGTEDPGVTGGPGDTLGHLNEVPGDATTVVTFVTASPGSDEVLAATSGDMAMEVTGDPGATSDPRDALGHLNEAPGDATTVVTFVTTSPGSDEVLVGTQSDVGVEGTAQPNVTGDPGDTLGHLNEVYGDATTTVTSVPVSPGGDKVLAATSGDVAMEGTGDPGVTVGPGDTLGHLSEAPRDATTVVAPVTTSPGGDKVLVGTQSDVAMEGTGDPGVTGDPGDIVGHLNEVYGDATTTVTSVPVSPGGDKMLLANGGDVAMEGTEATRVLCGPGDTLGRVTEAPGDATTVVAPVTATPGGDKVLVGNGGDVAMEGTAQPGATNCSWDTLGRVPEAPGDATTVVAPVTATPGGDKVLVGTNGDVAMEGTGDPGATTDPGDTLGHLNEAPGDATTVVAPVTTPPGGDQSLLANGGDVTTEGTAPPNVTGGPGDTLGHLNEAPGDATTTTVTSPETTPPGGDQSLLANGADAIMVAPGGDVMAGEAPPPCRGPAPHAAFPRL